MTRADKYALPSPVHQQALADVVVPPHQSYFFLLTVLLLVLLPFTYSTLFGGAERAASRVKSPCSGWNRKSAEVRRTTGGKGAFSFRCVSLSLVFGRARTDPLSSSDACRYLLLAAGWVAIAVIVQRASGIEAEGAQFDPFTILGVSSVRTKPSELLSTHC
jgi:translocation protein SEC63